MIRYAYEDTRTEFIVLVIILFIVTFVFAILIQNALELVRLSKIEELGNGVPVDFEFIEGDVNIGDIVYDTHYEVLGTYCGVDDDNLGVILIVRDETIYYLRSVLDNIKLINIL